MKLQLNCGSCMVKQAMSAMNSHGIDNQKQIEILDRIIADIPKYLNQPTPSHFQSILLEKLSAYLQVSDIYAEDKKRQNALTMDLIPYAQEKISQSTNPLYTSAMLAVEGNSIDQLFINNYNLKTAINDIVGHHFSIDHFNSLIIMLGRANNITYILDNAGEIIFDKIFIEYCQKWRSDHGILPARITTIVKGGPVLNDATEEDAFVAGIETVSTVINSGTNYLGLPYDFINNDSKEALSSADLVISKGQANFETLDEVDILRGKTFFLLKTKCFHVSSHLKVPEGSSVLYFPV